MPHRQAVFGALRTLFVIAIAVSLVCAAGDSFMVLLIRTIRETRKS